MASRRAKLYTKPELDGVKQAFKAFFRLDDNNPPTELNGTSVRISLSSISEVELEMRCKCHVDVRGIHFDYGLKGNDFHPVVRFMYANHAAKGDLELFPERYEVDKDQLVKIDNATALGYTDAYATRIRIDRLRSDVFTVFKKDGAEPDPRAEWFPYADNVNKLMGDNSAGRYLVVSCIAEPLLYAALGFVDEPAPEMRHLLALHMATIDTDLLADNAPTLISGYRDVAMDLGYLCPPRCK